MNVNQSWEDGVTNKIATILKMGIGITVALTLNGCATPDKTTNLLYKPGTTIYKKQADTDACRIQSFHIIPQALAQNVIPGSSSSGTTYCSGTGSNITCNTFGAYNDPPKIETYDVNQRLRNNYMSTCLAQKGYVNVTLPFCDDGGGYKNTDPAPPLKEIKCVSRKVYYIQ